LPTLNRICMHPPTNRYYSSEEFLPATGENTQKVQIFPPGASKIIGHLKRYSMPLWPWRPRRPASRVI